MKNGRPRNTPRRLYSIERKVNAVLRAFNKRPNASAQAHHNFYIFAESNGKKKPTLMILTKQDVLYWFQCADKQAYYDEIAFADAIAEHHPMTRPKKEMDQLRRKLAQLKGETVNG